MPLLQTPLSTRFKIKPLSSMHPPSSKLFAAGLFSVLALLGAGCGNGNTTVDTQTNTVNTTDGNGNALSAGDGAQIPANFPGDFPRYDGAKTTLAYTESNGQSGSLVQETTDSVESVQARVEASMQAQGFEKTNTLTSPGMVILS